MLLLFMLGVILLVLGLVLSIGGLVETDEGMSATGFIMLIVGGLIAFSIYSTQAERAVEQGDIQERYGVVTRVSNDSIRIDNKSTFSTNKYIVDKYETDLTDFKIGDLVKVEYLEGTLDNFVTTVDHVTLTEGEVKK